MTERPARFPSRFEGPKASPGFLLWQVTNLWQRAMREALAPVGLTHVQFVLLATAGWHERASGPVTQAELAAHARTDVTMTSQVLRALEKKGLVVRAADLLDARARRIGLTAEGRALLARALTRVENADQQFFIAAGKDVASLTRALGKLAETRD